MELGEVLNELRNSKFWEALVEVRDAWMADQERRININVRPEVPLMTEPNLGAILAARMAEMGGVIKFFTVLEKHSSSYINAVKEGRITKLKVEKNA